MQRGDPNHGGGGGGGIYNRAPLDQNHAHYQQVTTVCLF